MEDVSLERWRYLLEAIILPMKILGIFHADLCAFTIDFLKI